MFDGREKQIKQLNSGKTERGGGCMDFTTYQFVPWLHPVHCFSAAVCALIPGQKKNCTMAVHYTLDTPLISVQQRVENDLRYHGL